MKRDLLNLGFKEIDHSIFEKYKKGYKIFAEVLDDKTVEQFSDILNEDFVTYAALMPDTHAGYSMPIGGVCSTVGKIVPQFVGFDIGCGMCAYKTEFKKDMVLENKNLIYSKIRENVPLGFNTFDKNQDWNHSADLTPVAKEFLEKTGLKQLGTLGGGNHFIEIGHDSEDNVWIVIHSGSRGFGHKIATHYMTEAYIQKKNIEFSLDSLAEDFEKRQARFKAANPEKFAVALQKFLDKEVVKAKKKLENIKNISAVQEICALDVDSTIGKDYIIDQNFALEYALENRKRMIKSVHSIMNEISGTNYIFDPSIDGVFINRNHNHAEFNEKLGEWIHRKGATHAEAGMFGVIPGNMRDGSFIVIGKGSPDSLFSSSHGAGRVMSRKKAKELITLEEFKDSMKGVCGTIDNETIDESPFAYKDIFEVMELQKDLVDIVEHIKPLINIKDNSKSRF